MTQPTSKNLASVLSNCGFTALAERAMADEFHDFESPHAMPEHVLVAALRRLKLPAANALAQRVIDGEFDADKAESDAWQRSPQGQSVMAELWAGIASQGSVFDKLSEQHNHCIPNDPPRDSMFDKLSEQHNRCKMCGTVVGNSTESRDAHMSEKGCHVA